MDTLIGLAGLAFFTAPMWLTIIDELVEDYQDRKYRKARR